MLSYISLKVYTNFGTLPYFYTKSGSKGRPPYKICAWMWTHHAYLAGLEWEDKMYILWSLDAHQKRLKTAKYQAKTVRLDKMSRRDEVSQDKKLRLDKMSKQGSRQEGVKLWMTWKQRCFGYEWRRKKRRHYTGRQVCIGRVWVNISEM